jgi:hypothetical protein
MLYIQTKRDAVGRCNICAKIKKLSWDHVPPKGGIQITPTELESVFERLTNQIDSRPVISQNGLKFRTICSECNSRLGSQYDPTLNDFAIGVGRYLTTTLKVPSVVQYRTKPVLLIRALLGHLLAAKAEFDHVIFDERVRGFIFDETKQVPPDIHVFYWVYPYEKTLIMRDVLMPAVRGRFQNWGFFHILKYFPIAYLVTDVTRYEGLDEITVHRRLAPSDDADIPIKLTRINSADWPERVDEGNVLFGGQSFAQALSARPRKK